MNPSDIIFVLKWWLLFFVIGLIFLPLTTRIFSNFFDKGYVFSKILGMALISYAIFLLGILRILPFTEVTIFAVILVFLILNIFISKYFQKSTSQEPKSLLRHLRGDPVVNASKVAERTPSRWALRIPWKIFLFEEILFLATLIFWSYIRAHEPSIHGLEKYMDFGFINSILRTQYFPPVDMWFTPHSINYYYFGHLVTAVLTKLSGISSSITYNLMLSTIFALTFTGAFSIGANLVSFLVILRERSDRRISEILPLRQAQGQNDKLKIIAGGLLSGFLVSLAGNLHTIYAFFKPYENESPIPFWQLAFSFDTFPNNYWYPNATRFIENTIHEFPIYSFVVSDLHGHFLDIPFVLLTIALLLSLIFNFQFSIFNQIKNFKNSNSLKISNFKFQILLLAFLLAIMYMTNAWDGIIYFILAILILFYLNLKISSSNNIASKVQSAKFPLRSEASKVQSYLSTLSSRPKGSLKLKVFSFELWFYALRFALYAVTIMFGFFIFSLPFSLSFKPFASGIGILCAPEFLTNIGKLGPFLFEKDHCLRSPIWQLAILYGFFYFFVFAFLVSILPKIRMPQNGKLTLVFKSLAKSDVFVLLLIILSTLLIIIPEFIYVKDIYPGHYRANTMFKLVYQSFIMLSIVSGYIIVRTISNIRYQISNIFNFYYVYLLFAILFLILVTIYSYFAINSYYNLKTYQGLDGIKYLKNLYPADYEGILWINKNIKGQPVILEAQGDSYTDYARVSSNTGLPTVLGWAVHEWLWRGTYDIPSPRIPEVQKMYESEDLKETKQLINKYKIQLVFIGNLEKEKYPKLNEEKFKTLGKEIYRNGETKIYSLNY